MIQVIELYAALVLCFFLWIDIIEVANDMNKKHGINRLLLDLQELYNKLSALDLRKRMSLYHRSTDINEATDISSSLTKHLDKLIPSSKSNRASADNTTETISSIRQTRFDNTKRPSRQPQGIIKVVTDFIRPKKIFTRIKTSDQYMGEKLKDSTWSHIHTAKLHARQGNIINAKLHAGIANDALKEAAHYLSKEDYTVLCEEVVKVLKKLEE